jgi:hypothetical protein
MNVINKFIIWIYHKILVFSNLRDQMGGALDKQEIRTKFK